jgi:hypothetical protein
MVKTTPVKEFELFKREFLKWKKLLGLSGYRVYFDYEPLDSGGYADISINQNDMVATARLNSNLSKRERCQRSVKQSGKHEAIHLMLSRLETRATDRYTSEKEIFESVEELVFKLENLIGER